MTDRIEGGFCAAATPIGPDGGPDRALLAAHARALLEEGCHGIALLGTTGEANSFGLDERRAILDGQVEDGVEPARLLPGTGVSSPADTAALTRHAVQAGVRGVVMLPPFYDKDVTDEGLYRHYADVIERVGDDRLRVVPYHIPRVSGVPLLQSLMVRLVDAFPGIVVGVKDSHGDEANLRATMEALPRFGLMAGADPLLLSVLRMGGAGCITATSNLAAADLRIVYDGWDDPARSEEVEAAQARIVAWRELTSLHVQLPNVTAMLARRRGDDDWMRVRAPLVSLTEAERGETWARMEALER